MGGFVPHLVSEVAVLVLGVAVTDFGDRLREVEFVGKGGG